MTKKQTKKPARRITKKPTKSTTKRVAKIDPGTGITDRPVPAPGCALVLRTCNSDLTSYGGFQWPALGPVKCHDWNPTAECGNGLHGLLYGEGGSSYLDWSDDAVWMVVEVKADEVVWIDGDKVKFPDGEVMCSGTRKQATDYLIARCPGHKVHGGTATAGDRGTATAGAYGTATAGYRGTATTGDRGTATAGDRGTATAGDRGELRIRWWDEASERYRTAVGYVREDGIEPNTPYLWDAEARKFVKATT